MKTRRAHYAIVGLAAGAWVSLLSWLERDVNCWVDSCSVNAALWGIGLFAILIAGTVAIERRSEGVAFRSLAALASIFVLVVTAAGTGWAYLLDPTDTNEVVLVALFLPVLGIPVVFAVTIVITALYKVLRPDPSNQAE